MLNDSEWLQLYQHLVSSLDKRGYREVAEECRVAAAGRTEASTNGSGSEVGTRSLQPKEALLAAVEVLRIRLRETPLLAKRIIDELGVGAGVPAENIRWHQDAAQNEVPLEEQNFTAKDFFVPEIDLKQIDRSLSHLEDLLEIPKREIQDRH